MNKKVLTSSLALAFLLLNLVSTSGSNPPRPAPPADVLSFLPASDAVAVIDVHRLLTEALPRIFSGDTAKLLQANAEVEKFKTRTGIDPRSFDRVAVGLRYTYPSATVTKIETVAIAHGTFDARALVAAGRSAASGKYREVSHHGATIAVFNIGDQIKFLGLWNMKVNELAACALDRNTLAIGSLPNVRAAIEAGKSGRASSDLVALATRDPNALIGFGGNATGELLKNLNVGNDAIAKDINSIRQVYGSIGMTETDFTLLLVARAATAADAKNLSDTVTGLRQLGGILIARMAPAKKNLAQSALDNLKITTHANELEIRTQFAAADLSAFLKVTAENQSAPKEGATAPDFVLRDGAGSEWRLSDHPGKVVVLLFYPGDETPVCTRQMCSVRDRWPDYAATGAEVVGISTNTVESHRDFAEHHDLPLRLLADVDRRVADLYGARSIVPGKVARSVFVIDPKRVIRYRDVRPLGLFRPKDDDIIEAIRQAQMSQNRER